MKTHSEKAAELFCSGCNCSQAVLGAFAEDCGMDFEAALRLSSSFGGGMGRLRETCGAVTGMFMVAGLLKGYVDTDDKASNCNELLGNIGKGTYISDPRTEEYYKTRPCVNFVVTAADILDKHFFS